MRRIIGIFPFLCVFWEEQVIILRHYMKFAIIDKIKLITRLLMNSNTKKKKIVLSRAGSPLGRPVVRTEPLKPIPTHCPTQMYTYFKAIYPYHWKSLTEMFEDMMTRFVEEEPYKHGLVFRKPRTSLEKLGESSGLTGWSQCNVRLPLGIAEKVKAVAITYDQSSAAVCYTAMFWWAQYVYPPKVVLKQS